jgi:putative addiction module component (TIGR02574 family)
MSELLLELSTRAKTLSPEERAQLAEILLESIDEAVSHDLSPEWEREIERRVAAYDRGETKTYLAEDVFAEARHIAP